MPQESGDHDDGIELAVTVGVGECQALRKRGQRDASEGAAECSVASPEGDQQNVFFNAGSPAFIDEIGLAVAVHIANGNKRNDGRDRRRRPESAAAVSQVHAERRAPSDVPARPGSHHC